MKINSLPSFSRNRESRGSDDAVALGPRLRGDDV
jgi:hypothetical protein